MRTVRRLFCAAAGSALLAGGPVAAAEEFQWPAAPRAPAGAPNILVIMTDDVGFAASSTFGGPIATPTFDRLAARGLRYNNFHTTGICSASRAALLTGRNPHRVGMSGVTDSPAPAAGYSTVLPKDAATVAQILKDQGYSTAMFGKSHLVPLWEQSAAGPFDRWPTGLGFEYFYGFLNGDTHQFAPQLYLGTNPVEPPANDPDYILDKDLADRAIQWITAHEAAAPDKPFLIHYAPGTAHSPHHAPADWLDRYKGRFDQGWDALRAEILARQKRLGVVPGETKLSPRPPMLPAWNSLSPEQRRLYARMMEVYAAALSYADHQIGRILETLENSGDLDDTLIIYIQGDNGSSAEGAYDGLWNEMTFVNQVKEDVSFLRSSIDDLGGPRAYNHFPAAWANAMSTPFPYFKRVASHLGATHNGMVISWPRKIQQRGLRSQFHHVIDVAPTILEAAGVQAPRTVAGVPQTPLDGVSMAYTFHDPNAEGRRRTQYFELSGDQAIYHDGWLASTAPSVMPWQLVRRAPAGSADAKWELYDLRKDFSQSTAVSASNPAKLRELKTLFAEEAARNQVFPVPRSAHGLPPYAPAARNSYRYSAPVTRIPALNAPDLLNRSFEITAVVEAPHGGASGMLVTQGGRFGGYGLYLQDARPVFTYNNLGLRSDQLRAKQPLAAGRHVIGVGFTYDGGGAGRGGALRLTVDGQEVASGRLESTIPARVSLSETFDIGSDTGTPVSEDYAAPFRFSGDIVELEIRPR